MRLGTWTSDASTVPEHRGKTKSVLTHTKPLLSDVLHHQLNLFSHSMSHSITPPENNRFPVRISNYIDAFSLCEWALQFGRLAWLCEWTPLWLALLIAPLVMSLAVLCTPPPPHLWQIMLLKWLMCHPLHGVLNHVAHPHDLCSMWDTARPRSDPDSASLSLSGMHHRRTIGDPPLPPRPLDSDWTSTTPLLLLNESVSAINISIPRSYCGETWTQSHFVWSCRMLLVINTVWLNI